MPQFFKSDKFVFYLLSAVFCCLLPFFGLHQGLLTVDAGREFYIAEQVLKGEVLYKDIFNIYGALPYMFNALLFAVFGAKMKTLYVAGLAVSWLIVTLIYFISREFLTGRTSFLIALTTMTSLVFGVFYNSAMPYTYAITYALFAFLVSVLMLTKYVKTGNKVYAYGACLAAGGSFACKYEFLPYALVLFYVLKEFDRKSGIRCLCYTAFLPALTFGILLLQGLNFADIKTMAVLLNKMLHAPSMTVFCKKFAIYPSLKAIIALSLQNGIFAAFAVLPVLNLILFLKDIKTIVKNKPVFVFMLCAFAACFKCIFYLNVNHYGLYVFPICLIATVILLEKYSKRVLSIVLAATVFLFGAYNFDMLQKKTYKLETAKGSVYTFERDGKPIKTAVDYINANTGENATVLVLPEGSIINFLSGRKSMNMYHSLIPLYYDDVFGEEKIIGDFRKTPPEAVILLKHNQIEYGKNFFGKDYGKKLFETLNNDYEKTYDDEYMSVYKKNF